MSTKYQLDTFKSKLTNYLERENALKGSWVGLSIRSAGTGELLYSQLGDHRFKPASNMKLLTAATALSVLGETYTFSTEIWYDGTIEQGTLHGSLYIKGKGDPTLLPEDYDQFVKQIKKAGINKITGNIFADDSWYDAVRLSADMIWSDEQWYYGSQVSALTLAPNGDYDTGTVILTITPNKRLGEKPSISVYPKTDYVQIFNEAVTLQEAEEEDLIIDRKHGKNDITISGHIGIHDEPRKEWLAVWEPTLYAIAYLKAALNEKGVKLDGILTRGTVGQTAKKIYTHHAIPLAEIIVPFMKLSNNGIGEILVKEMGKYVHNEGSWEKGLQVLQYTLQKEFGLDIRNLQIRDGSGISHINLIPPNEITNLLYRVKEKKWFSTFLQSLPISGEENRLVGGTLRNRLQGFHVQAKTGTIYGVSTLAGYVDEIIFSIMLNHMLDEEEGPLIEDHIIKLITTYLKRQ
ncbi:D-alanyl-D-alanine carboxypeptidase/D-alanyl-D-alanine-endopeptidase [Virgibacillus soli]|uniref:D-alanyl-D-alanine carboxypeptidase/D-alanyl-D-alanine-endopeptidase n=1 Tax=Paracerasibacillus soli TaxID=480284 RepID=A0ABU5CNT2_9BACI|nr:D-alanyl-D-alanine carboxypeptidase/D-alanyl-D-alanine-endopeptidase [Virgibacillus soli]MDY0408017.1 D-alanyl-D-alanine carboxypeptidase/D-alanyl-D-alanine-endopeptidase [Virgibacillus soli]